MRRHRSASPWLTGAFLGGSVLLWAGLAQAQDLWPEVGTLGFALQRFTASAAGDRLFSVPSPYTAGNPGLHAAVVFDYASHPLVLSRVNGITDPTGVVTDQLYFHVNGTVALFDRVAVNVEIPVAVDSDGEDPKYRGAWFTSPHRPFMGDIRVGLRARIYGEEHDLFQVGAQALVWGPTGNRWDFTSDETFRGMPQLLLGGFHDRFVWSFAGGAHIRSTILFNHVQIGSTMELGAGIGFRLGDERRAQIGPEVTVGVSLVEPHRRNTQAELLLGAKYRFGRDIEAGVAAGPGLTPGYGTPDVRFVFALVYTPDSLAPADTDEDGVADAEDVCPRRPAGDAPDPARPGCPRLKAPQSSPYLDP